MTEEESKITKSGKKNGEAEGGEEKLIESGHFAIVSLDQIVRVIF